MFANPANFNAYLVAISWSDERKCLVFEEKSRFDGKYLQKGTVHIPFGTSYMNWSVRVPATCAPSCCHCRIPTT